MIEELISVSVEDQAELLKQKSSADRAVETNNPPIQQQTSLPQAKVNAPRAPQSWTGNEFVTRNVNAPKPLLPTMTIPSGPNSPQAIQIAAQSQGLKRKVDLEKTDELRKQAKQQQDSEISKAKLAFDRYMETQNAYKKLYDAHAAHIVSKGGTMPRVTQFPHDRRNASSTMNSHLIMDPILNSQQSQQAQNQQQQTQPQPQQQPRVMNPSHFLNMYNLQHLNNQQRNQQQPGMMSALSRQPPPPMTQQQQQQMNILQANRESGQFTTASKPGPRSKVPTSSALPGKGSDKVNEALSYLESVKDEYESQPKIYHKFLDTMKKFKSNEVHTPGVLRSVIQLFKTQVPLIVGFNKFLPEDFLTKAGDTPGTLKVLLPKEEPIILDLNNLDFEEFDRKMKPFEHNGLQPLGDQMGITCPNNARQANFAPSKQVMNPPQGFHSVPVHPSLQQPSMVQQHHQQVSFLPPHQQQPMDLDPTLSLMKMQNGNNGGNYGKSEFNEAISYVSKIKKRFADDSSAYRTFLDVLHTFQKDHGTIHPVVQKVSKLFEGNEDLLRDFVFFLPDDIREKAKKSIEELLRRKIINTGIESSHRFEDKYGERIIWQKLKHRFRDGALFSTFLGVLEMMMKGLITKKEFLHLTTELMKKSVRPLDRALDLTKPLDVYGRKLLEQLNAFLCTHNMVDSPILSAFYSLPASEMDFESSFRPTPSYRQLPDAYLRYSQPEPDKSGEERVRFKLNACSGRTHLCDSVLNDKYVSVPTGSEDFSFKHFRKNMYEEALFKCEDERHAFDMQLEWNKRCIVQLTKLTEEVQNMKLALEEVKQENDPKTKKVKVTLGKDSLSVLHLKAISRVYGVHAPDFIELLRVSPEATLPVVLKRVKEHDVVMERRKVELTKQWKKIHEDNFPKSLDHRSFYFKQTDKKDIGTKNLVAQLKAIMRGQTASLKGHKSDFVKFMLDVDPKAKDHHHMEVSFDEIDIHSQCFQLMLFLYQMNTKTEAPDYEHNTLKLLAFMKGTLACFVGLSDKDFSSREKSSHFAMLKSLLSDKGRDLIKDVEEPVADGEKVFPTGPKMSGKKTFYGSSSAFLFFRLYNILYERLLRAKYASEDAELKHSDGPGDMVDGESQTLSAAKRYGKIVDGMHLLIAGKITSNEFEDSCREVLETDSYFLFTVEKLFNLLHKHMFNALISEDKVKQVEKRSIAFQSEPTVSNLVGLYRNHFQVLMNQVDSLCFRVKLCYGIEGNRSKGKTWERPPTIEVTICDSFLTSLEPCVEADHLSAHCKKVGGTICEYPLFGHSATKLLNGEKEKMEKLLESKTDGDRSKPSAKKQWWFVGRYEELLSKQSESVTEEDVAANAEEDNSENNQMEEVESKNSGSEDDTEM